MKILPEKGLRSDKGDALEQANSSTTNIKTQPQ